MKPLSLFLRGATGILNGLGREEIQIDFSQFASGLVAIVGPNGSGKTTILDNLHPYLQLASRTGSLASHFCRDDSVRDFRFELAGREYRSLILMDPKHVRMEATLYCDGTAANDGRVTTYKECLQQLLGSSELFFKSIFFAQGALGFTDLTPAKRKELLLELLNLTFYERAAQAAKERCENVARELQVKKGLIAHASQELDQRDEFVRQVAASKSELANIRLEITATQERLTEVNRLYAEIQIEAEAARQARKQLEALDVQIRGLKSRRAMLEKSFRSRQERLAGQRRQIQTEVDRVRETLARRDVIAEKIIELGECRKQLETHVALKAERDGVDREESAARLEFKEAMENHLIAMRDLERKRDEQINKLHRVDQEISTARVRFREDCARAKEQAQLIDAAPCAALPEIRDRCSFLARARDALEQLPQLEHQLLYLHTANYLDELGHRIISDEIIKTKKEILRLGECTPVFDEASFKERREALGYDAGAHERLQTEIRRLHDEGWEQQERELLVADSVLAEKQQLMDTLDKQIVENAEVHGQEAKQLDAEVEATLSQREGLAVRCTVRDDSAVRREQRERDRRLEQLRENEKRFIGQAATAEAALDRLEKLENDLQQVQGEVLTQSQALQDWKLLHYACSKDGIPALELDEAGPAVSQIANGLLASAFDTMFQIRFDTVRASRDSTRQLETFSVKVLGPNAERDIEDHSGGEKVWIERALSEAIAIYLAEHSGREYLASFQDEADGALDPERRQCYLAMLQESFRRGRRFYTFLITQSPEI